MKVVALAAALTAFAGSAIAEPMKTWTDAQNRFSMDVPQAWPVDRQSKPDEDFVWLIAGLADAECSIFVLPNANTAAAPVDRVRQAYVKPLGIDGWAKELEEFNTFSGATVMTSEIDVERGWPLQTAEFSLSDGSPAFGAGQGRPGFEVWHFCRSYDGNDRTSTFAAMANSVKSPKDAEWAEALAQAAAKAAAPVPPPPPPPPPESGKKDKKARN